MKEFMALIHKQRGHLETKSPEQEQTFLQACIDYIGKLTKGGNLIAAQPLVRDGKFVSRSKGVWKDGPYNETKEVIAGYYHLLAKDLDEAIELVKDNPEFVFSEQVRIEVRPIKMKEVTKDYVYPKS